MWFKWTFFIHRNVKIEIPFCDMTLCITNISIINAFYIVNWCERWAVSGSSLTGWILCQLSHATADDDLLCALKSYFNRFFYYFICISLSDTCARLNTAFFFCSMIKDISHKRFSETHGRLLLAFYFNTK